MRIEPRLFVGLTGHQVIDTREWQTLRLPPGVTQEQVDRLMPGDSAVVAQRRRPDRGRERAHRTDLAPLGRARPAL